MMTLSGRIYNILNVFQTKKKYSSMDLSGDQVQKLTSLKIKVLEAAQAYEKEFKELLKLPNEYVISWYANDKFMGYIDYIEEDGTKISTYVEDIDKVKHEVFSTKEEAEKIIKALYETDQVIKEEFIDSPISVYLIEQRF